MLSTGKIFDIGHFQAFVLIAIDDLGRNAVGVEIRDAVLDMDKPKNIHTRSVQIYSTLRRLEERKLIRSRVAKSRREKRGRSSRMYVLTHEGKKCVAAIRRSLEG